MEELRKQGKTLTQRKRQDANLVTSLESKSTLINMIREEECFPEAAVTDAEGSFRLNCRN